ncbi:MAG TPA: hypothetical protein VHM19_01295, partial [Polyangiales bacterium]|nr:hypothetical protein [Polyangiales bacterium]
GYELRKRSWQVGLQWHAGYAPQINSVLGTLQSRLQGGMRATLTFYRTSLSASVDGAQTLPTDAPDAVRLISTTLGADRALLEWLDAQAGAQLTWQRSGIVSTFPQSFWLLYAGLGAHAPSLRF